MYFDEESLAVGAVRKAKQRVQRQSIDGRIYAAEVAFILLSRREGQVVDLKSGDVVLLGLAGYRLFVFGSVTQAHQQFSG